MDTNTSASELKEEHLRFTHLPAYASFLLHNHLESVVKDNMNRGKSENTLLIKAYAHLEEEELYKRWKDNFVSTFLLYLTQEYHSYTFLLEQWKANDSLTPRINLSPPGFLSLNTTRKESLIEFIPLYTDSQKVALDLVKELDNYFKRIELIAIQAFENSYKEEQNPNNKVLQGILTNLPVIVTKLDNTGTILESRGAGLKNIGLQDNKLVGTNLFDNYQARNVKKALVEKTAMVFEGSVGSADNLRHFQNYYFPDGNAGLLGFSIDITERKLAEEKLQENQDFTKQIMDASPDIIFVINVIEDKIVFVSQEVLPLLGYSQEQFCQMSADDKKTLIHEEDISRREAFYESFTGAPEEEIRTLEYRLKDVQGNWHWFSIRGKILKKTKEGAPKCVIGVARDITGQKRTQLELIEKNRELSLLNEELKAAKESLLQINNELEKRVYERTKELSATEEELRQMLEHTVALGKKVTESENLLSNIIDQSPVSTWISDAKGTQIRVNKACLQLFGVTDPAVGIGKYNLFKDSLLSQSPYVEDVKKVFAEGKIAVFTMDYNLSEVGHIEVPTGIPITIKTTIFPVKDAEGQVTNAVIQHEDITLRKKAENALKASEERYKAFIQQSSEAIWRFELDIPAVSIDIPEEELLELCFEHMYLAECNDAMARMYGFTSAEEIVGIRLRTMMDPSDPVNLAFIRTFIRSGYQIVDAESVEMDRNGQVKYFLNNLVGIIEGGKLCRIWGTQRDITGNRNAQEALRRSEEQLRLITDALPVLITYVDKEERYRFNNKTYENWFNKPGSSVYGKTVKEIIGYNAYEKVKEYMQRALRGETVNFEGSLPYKDAGTRYIAVNYIPDNSENEIKGYYALITDISEQKRYEEALEKALKETEAKNQELVKTNAILDNFVYMAAHDLRSPVSNLKMIMHLFGKVTDKNSKPELFSALKESVNRLDQTIEGLVEVIEIQSTNRIPSREVSFQRLVDLITKESIEQFTSYSPQIETNFEKVISIHYIEAFLLSIIKNLVTNAIKYSSPARNPLVSLHTYRENGFVVLEVKDNGMGMDLSRYGKNIFKPFTRFTSQAQGKGLGLHLVKTMVEKNGGLIQVESQVDVGTTFKIFLKEYE